MSTESPAKRQRQTGSFSPASPPYHLAAKEGEQPNTTIHQTPNTPTSPPYMSSIANGSDVRVASSHAPLFTPPSSFAMSAQTSQQPMNTTNAFPTPASTAGSASFAQKSDGGDAQMTGIGGETGSAHDSAMGNSGDDHRHTDHDRQGTGSSTSAGIGMDRKQMLASMPTYKLSEKPYEPSRPHVTQNLIELYGLSSITSSVARFDPVTGEKINKLRKSYENQLKGFGLAGGKNKAEAVPGQLMDYLRAMPPEEWYSQKVYGKEIRETPTADMMSKINRAVKMTPGKLPPAEVQKWKSRIGTDDGPSKRPATDSLDNPSKKIKHGPTPNPGTRPTSAAPSPAMKPARPERTGKKRSYVETSFKGYGEGFADDDPTGDSTGAEDAGRLGANGSKKKRRKDIAAGSPLGFNERRGSYNVGMVGVRQ
ncbi:Rox3-domain-containing protein [Saccharata proteae CBS 121410]|uniref:Mediator of RNA polymerase II transcription subunit 19 n=1 Tax=Saccharata proteae CBS 121410 TaxID=1314787 RepID=A0A6A5YA83_9PEZI|nr:Rox3-domain-containing protein [Saccharata proteae CBS 121410]